MSCRRLSGYLRYAGSPRKTVGRDEQLQLNARSRNRLLLLDHIVRSCLKGSTLEGAALCRKRRSVGAVSSVNFCLTPSRHRSYLCTLLYVFELYTVCTSNKKVAWGAVNITVGRRERGNGTVTTPLHSSFALPYLLEPLQHDCASTQPQHDCTRRQAPTDTSPKNWDPGQACRSSAASLAARSA